MNDSVRQLVKTSFSELILDVIAFASTLPEKHFPLVNYTAYWMEKAEGSSYQSKAENRSRESFRAFLKTYHDKVYSLDTFTKLHKTLSDYFSINGIFFPYRSEPWKELTEAILIFYFERIKKFNFKENVLELCVQELFNDCLSPKAKTYAIYKLEEFDALKEFSLEDGIKFRRITYEDIDRYAGYESYIRTYPDYDEWLYSDSWVCEIEKDIDKRVLIESDDGTPTAHGFHKIIDDVALALSLCTPSKATFQLIRQYDSSPFLGFSRKFGGLKSPTGSSTDKTFLDDDLITKFQKTYRRLKELQKNKDIQKLALPLRRLRASANRKDKTDHLVDCVIGLEFLLVNDNKESSYKFRTRGAALLPDSYGNQEERSKFLNSLYDLRSKIVHGSHYTERDIDTSCKNAENALRDLIYWYIFYGIKHGTRDELLKSLDSHLIKGGESLRAE